MLGSQSPGVANEEGLTCRPRPLVSLLAHRAAPLPRSPATTLPTPHYQVIGTGRIEPPSFSNPLGASCGGGRTRAGGTACSPAAS